jgi:TonB family protein
MRQRWQLAPLALALGLWPRAAPAETLEIGAVPEGVPPTAIALAAPAAVLERLPPHARPDGERGLSWVRSGPEAPYGAHLVEVIEEPSPSTGDPEWLQVEYTVDPDLDERVQGVLRRERIALGHVILMDPATGEVFAYVSTEPETFPATRAYPTASLMKVVTAAAALQRVPDVGGRECRYIGSPYEVGPAQLDPPAVGGTIDPLRHALAISNNQCFARLAVRDVGAAALLAEMRRAGMLEEPAPRHAPGRVEPLDDDLDLAHLGSGLAGSFVTPLAAARLAALLARGELVRPWWIARVRDSRGNPLAVPGAPPPRPVWPDRVSDELRQWMVAVTEEGTARRGFHGADGAPLLGSIRVSGKTGTLRGADPEGLYQWFIGVAPAEAPRLAIASVVVDAARGETSAARVAALSLREVFCGSGSCDAAKGEVLHGRSRARDADARRELAALRELTLLDQPPRPIASAGFDFPPHLLRRKADGRIVLLVDLNPQGEVVDVQVDSSDLPDFDEFVSSAVRSWRFTPPTQRGQPVAARARLPIPIHVE